jgi:cellulose synthase operon protein C
MLQSVIMSKLAHGLSAKARVVLLLAGAALLSACSSSAERAEHYYEHGMQLLAGHEDQKAAIEFKNAIALKRDLIPAWRGLAQIAERDHRWGALVPILRTIVALDPKDSQTRLKLAQLMVLGGAPDEALEVVNGFDAKASASANVLALKAAIYYRLNNIEAARREANAALKADPDNVDALKVLATDRLASGDPRAALQLLSQSSASGRADLGVELIKIKAYQQLGDSTQVEKLLHTLVELYPKEILFRKELVDFYVNQHRPADAERELRDIIAAYPNNPEFELDLVHLIFATEGPAAARAELVTRINAGGDVFPYQTALAEFDFAQGNLADSFKLLQTLASNSSSPKQALAAKLELADLELQSKNVPAADALIADILASDGQNADALRLRATIELARGETDAAVSDLTKALDRQPRSTALMSMLAVAYERGGSIELADKEYSDAIRVSNLDPGLYLNYAAFLQRRGRLQRADAVLSDFASRQPSSVAILSALAQIKLARQDWAAAEQVGEQIQRLGHSAEVADQVLGLAFSGEHKYDASISAFQSGVAAAPNAVQPMAFLVNALLESKQTDRALSFLKTVLDTNPENAEAYVLLGSIRLANGAPDQAINDFKTAIDKQPRDAAGYRALADLYFRQKDNDAAIKTLRAGLNQNPTDVTLHMALATMLEATSDYEAAISEYERVLSLQPSSVVAANNLASLLLDHRTDKVSLARAQALAGRLRQSPVPQFKDTLGWARYRSGDVAEAVPLLQEAADALPDQAVVHYHLGMSYLATGQAAGAVKEFKAALTKGPSSDLAKKIQGELTGLTIQ